MSKTITRTIDVEIKALGVRNDISKTDVRDRDIGVQLENVNVSIDLIDGDSNTQQFSVILDKLIKGDKGDTPIRGVDYWNQEDITYIENYIYGIVDPIEWEVI